MIVKELIIKNLVQKTVHLGHKKKLRDINSSNLVIGYRKNIDILNLNYTIINMLKVLPLIASIVSKNGNILTITNNKKFDDSFIGQPISYDKWLSGTLTNYKSLKKTQKNSFLLKRMPNIVFLLNHQRTYFISKEVNLLKIPLITINDSNSNMNYAQYPIPGNDNSIVAEKFYLNLIKSAIFNGYVQKVLGFKKYKKV